MTSITAHQTKLDLELVPKENRLDIGKCNGRIPHGLKPKEETFQICPRVPGRDFDALPSEEDTLSFLRDLGHTEVINSLNDVVINHMHRPWRTFATIINRSLSGKTSGLDKLHLSRAQILWGMYHQKCVYSNIARKFKKASPTKKDSDLVPVDEELVTKGKRVKRSVKKSSTKPTTGIVIREPLVETKSKGKEKEKEKEKVDVARGKGIELLSEVALTEKAQLKEVRKKRLRDFHKTHPSGSSTGAEKPPSVEKITPTGNDEDDNNDEQESKDESSEQENESEEQEYDDLEQEDESDDDNQEEEETQDWKSPLRLTTQEQVVEDAHATISIVMKKTEVPVTSSSRSSDLASKFLNFSDITHTDAEIVSLFDVPVQHEVPNTQTTTLLPIPVSVITTIPLSLQTFTPPPIVSTPTPPPTTEATNPPTILPDFASVFRFNDRITALEIEIIEIKKDPLHTQVTTLVDKNLDTRLGETREEFMNFLSESLTARIKEQVKDQLPQILPKEVSNFAPPMIEKLIKESRDEVTLAKVSSQPKSTYEATSTLTEFELKKILPDKIEKSKDKDEDPSAGLDQGIKKRKLRKDAEPITGLKKKDSMFGSSKGTKSQPKSSGKSVQLEELVFEFKKPTPPQESTDPDWNIGKNTQEGPTQNWLMTLAASTSTDKSLKDFDELMSTPIDFSGYILNGLKIENLTQEILLGPAFRLLKGTRSNYAELEYDFEECYKALLEKLDWENPKGSDYPFDLSKPFPLITRGNCQRVPFEFFINNDLNYQKKINVTKPDTTRPDLRKRHPYTPYKDPQGFIYVDNYKRNRLMRSDKLYKFSDGTLSRLLSSLEDITNNIDIEYLPKRRWRTLEKKRAHFMIKDINKLLKERRMMRSLEKFVGGRLYGTDLRLL
ncbi:hypothetical protein Tco_0978724 [Tanacetum coccineum]|uniref:Reverse transcriptase domain-containing protein n=1 Tax=Tanacetum coccineum TaxID=301880 RepID=A0ABQ5EP83_9ASTR